MDRIREQHQKAIEALQAKYTEKQKYIETEKKRLIEDMKDKRDQERDLREE